MNAYGEVAVESVRLCTKRGLDPRNAWHAAAKLRFPDSPSSQTKGCPRGAFVGLCAAGLVRDVAPETEAGQLGKNARYACAAIKILIAAKPTIRSATELWREVGQGKRHNHQMDVVLALWSRGLIHGS
ncbi:DUF6979 family protein [Oleiharenicola lentus]|uniref:DUF6979 family protein n=1 Tax=Oleiharenicola lentus TaxID=2508720 RepID=UPI0026C6D4ED